MRSEFTLRETAGCYVWERTGKVWIKDSTDNSPTLLLDISEEVGAWQDHGMLGFALNPNFRVNGYFYLLYVVDRYYLLNFGSPNYDPNANQYNAATIGRLTRYTCRSSDGFRSVDLSSRSILLGETKQTGFPVLSYTRRRELGFRRRRDVAGLVWRWRFGRRCRPRR